MSDEQRSSAERITAAVASWPECDELVATGRARAHHVLPDSGWVTASIADPVGAEPAIELFRLSYERARHARRSQASALGTKPDA